MQKFLGLLAFLSVNIGFLNLLPIPALDGGHLFFLLAEKVARREFNREKLAWINGRRDVFVAGINSRYSPSKMFFNSSPEGVSVPESAYPKPRKATREVRVGNIIIGGNAPITVQSMTKTATADIDATVAQISLLQAAGCELIRLAVPDQKSADVLGEIKRQINLPLVADIHFKLPPGAHCYPRKGSINCA